VLVALPADQRFRAYAGRERRGDSEVLPTGVARRAEEAIDRAAHRPTKNWKFRVGDLDDRARWKEYTKAYSDAVRQCSTKWAPWYLVPADDKLVRNWLIARTIADTLSDLDLKDPKASAEVRARRID